MNKNIFFKIFCNECEMSQSQILKLIDLDKNIFYIKVERENFYEKYKFFSKNNSSEQVKQKMNDSIYIGEELHNTDSNIILKFKNSKYIFIESKNEFFAVQLDLSRFTNNQIHDKFSDGIKTLNEYNYQLNKFGENLMKMKNKTFGNVILKKFFTPLILYRIFISYIWIVRSYTSFLIIILSFSTVLIIITSYQKYINFKRIFNENEMWDIPKIHKNVDIIHQMKIWVANSSFKKLTNEILKYFFNVKNLENNIDLTSVLFLVPGDILLLEQSKKVPCDCLILDGSCSVTESYLTGETSLVLKEALPRNDLKFSYENQKSILFQGTDIRDCDSSFMENGTIYLRCMVLNTGYNTYWGSFLQNILFPKKMNFKFYRELKIFTISMIIIYIVTISILIKSFILSHAKTNITSEDLKKFIFKCLDLITVILPPSLHICMNVTSFYFNEILKTKDITCLSEKRLNAAGKVNIVVLDKTGTLTSDELEISGFQTTQMKSIDGQEKYEFDKIEKKIKIFNSMHSEFWLRFTTPDNNNKYENYQNKLRNNPIYFLECLATCLSIDKLRDDKILGNAMDKKLFDTINWNLEKIEEKWHDFQINYQVCPKKGFKITEQMIFNQIENASYGKQFILKIIKRFEFSSIHQSNSVIVKNELDGNYRFFIKGAPEKIKNLCDLSTLPKNFNEVLKYHTKKGFRVLACATKPLTEREILSNLLTENNQEENDSRYKFEIDLNFLGFIIVSNKLKTVTQGIIKNLKQSSCKLIMATGDNPFTSLSVAKQCSLIDNSRICLIDIDEGQLFYNWMNEDEIIISNNCDEEEMDESFTNDELHDSKIDQKSEELNYINLDDDGSEFSKNAKKKLLDNHKKMKKNIIKNNINSIFKSLSNKNYDLMNFFVKNKIQDDFVLCISGAALRLIFDYSTKYSKSSINVTQEFKKLYCEIIPKFIAEKGKIFYRMNPDDKVKLINFIKNDKNAVVAMCGDGANDCGALLSADIGISLSDNDSTKRITSHFSYKYDSIACIDIILRVGRSCFENNIMILKYIVLYAASQLTIFLLLDNVNSDLTDSQYFYLDLVITLISSVLAAKTGASYTLYNQNSYFGILDMKFLYKMVGQLIIQPSMIYLVFRFFKDIREMNKIDSFYSFSENRKKMNEDEKAEVPFLLNSYCFIFVAFQNIIILFIYNMNSKHRKYFYSNKAYLFYFSFVSFLTLDNVSNIFSIYEKFIGKKIVLLDNLQSLNDINNELNRIFLLLAIIICAIVTYLFEKILDLLIKDV